MVEHGSLRLLFIMSEYPLQAGGTGGGGIGSYGGIIAPALAERGHEVHVLSCKYGQEPSDYFDHGVWVHRRGQISLRRGYLKVAQQPVQTVTPSVRKAPSAFPPTETTQRMRGAASDYLAYRRLKLKFDVIECPDWGAEGLFFALFRPAPLVVPVHNPFIVSQHFVSNGAPLGWDGRMASTLERYAVHRADVVTSASQLMVKELNRLGWLRKKRVEIIPYAIDWQSWCAVKPVSTTSPVVLFIGRLDRLKAPELLIEAVGMLRETMPEVRAIFIGKSNGERDGVPYVEWLKGLAEKAGGCEFVGEVPREALPQYLEQARVVAVPSQFESFSLVAAEAMSAGRPVVLTESTGISELVREFGGGQVVSNGNAAALAEALQPYLSDAKRAAEVGDRGRQLVQWFCDPAIVAAQRERAYRNAISLRNS